MHAAQPARPWYRSPLSLAIAATLACAPVTHVAAQDGEDGSAQAGAAVDLDTVVVTANKRVENVREVGASISVVGERQLENLGASSLSDYAALIPGMQVQSGGTPGLTSVSLRGIAATSSGATVATYIDEVPVGSSGIYQGANTLMLDLLPYDITRVEVLRGPQGTLYGAGAIGGLLKYVTREPDLSVRELRVGLGLRSVQDGGDEWNGRFGASVPLQDDRLALRVSFARNGIPGFTDNAVDGRRDIDPVEQSGARAALLWDGERSDMRLSLLRQRIRADDRSSVALDPDTQAPLDGHYVTRAWQPQPFEKTLTLAALGFDVDLGWADLVSASGWSKTDTRNQIDATIQFGEVANAMLGLPDPGSANVDYRFDLDKFTQEFRLASKTGGAFEWMAGVFYTKEDALQTQSVWLGQLDGSALPSPYDEMFSALGVLEMPSTYEETALFANLSWRLGERFKVDGGVRLARNEQWFSQNGTAGILVPIGEFPGRSSEDVFTWSLSPQWKLGEDTMVYVRAATGYQPGGPNVALPGMPSSVDSSMLDSYEVGLKSQFADRRVSLDLAAFRIDWDDIQVASSFNGIGGLVNGGEATSEGVELAMLLHPTAALSFGVNGAYTKAKVKNDFERTVIPQDGYDVVLNTGLAGDRLPYVPEWSWSAVAEYAFTLSGGYQGQAGAAWRWVGERVNSTSERQQVTAAGDPSTVLVEELTPPVEIGSYSALDLYAGIGRNNWELRAYVDNVTGRKAWSAVSPADSEVLGGRVHLAAVPILPRTVGLELDFRF